jgi:hypothetical protein
MDNIKISQVGQFGGTRWWVSRLLENLSEFFGVLGVQEGGYQGYYKNLSDLFCVIGVQVVECNLISAKRWCNKNTWMILV